jgi:glycosyltransferase involved in cell wall biosynthesis
MVSIIIPAFREAERIGLTLAGVRRGAEALAEPIEVVVVDDGSDDGTAERALGGDEGKREREKRKRKTEKVPPGGCCRFFPFPFSFCLRLVRLEQNQGKGAALARGLAEARGEWIVMLDADLGETAAQFPCLLAPVRAGVADMTIALFLSPALPVARGGFGLALRVARWGVARLTGRVLQAPLSGQRAFAAAHLLLLTPLEPGFGLEVGLDIDALRAGLRVLEVPTTMAHAATGRDWAGFRHRGRQLAHILRALWRRQKEKGKRKK